MLGVLSAALLLQTTSSASTFGIPDVTDWPHRPVFLQASNATTVTGGMPPSLGIPFEVDSPFFRGKILIRLRNAKSDDESSHNEYFQSHTKRLMQTVVQGRFKRPMRFDQVYIGSVFEEPIPLAPPRSIMKVLKRLLPGGVILDLHSDTPKVLTLYAGTAQTMREDVSGAEPDIRNVSFLENIGESLGQQFRSISHRQRHMMKRASKFTFRTDRVYTFHTHDDTMDYGTYEMKLPVYGKYKLGGAIGAQPMSLAAVTDRGETIFRINVWHESIYTPS